MQKENYQKENYQKENYQKNLEGILSCSETIGKKLLVHSCCAPCSSYVLEFLREYFDITAFFYNPNITNGEEYKKRVDEEKRLIAAYNQQLIDGNFEGMHTNGHARKIEIIEGIYEPERFLEGSKGLEKCLEGGERCAKCFALRLEESAKIAAKQQFDYFTTTLTISPLKNAALLNQIGSQMAEKYGVAFLPSDFKKKNGYQRSIELSAKFALYRQDYCGCGFSKAESEERRRSLP